MAIWLWSLPRFETAALDFIGWISEKLSNQEDDLREI